MWIFTESGATFDIIECSVFLAGWFLYRLATISHLLPESRQRLRRFSPHCRRRQIIRWFTIQSYSHITGSCCRRVCRCRARPAARRCRSGAAGPRPAGPARCACSPSRCSPRSRLWVDRGVGYWTCEYDWANTSVVRKCMIDIFIVNRLSISNLNPF